VATKARFEGLGGVTIEVLIAWFFSPTVAIQCNHAPYPLKRRVSSIAILFSKEML